MHVLKILSNELKMVSFDRSLLKGEAQRFSANFAWPFETWPVRALYSAISCSNCLYRILISKGAHSSSCGFVYIVQGSAKVRCKKFGIDNQCRSELGSRLSLINRKSRHECTVPLEIAQRVSRWNWLGRNSVCCRFYNSNLPQICNQCQRHRWQIMGTKSDWLHLKENLKKKIFYIYVSFTIQRCPNKIFKTVLIEDFLFAPIWCTLKCEYLREFSTKFETDLMGYSWHGGNWFMKKTWSRKSQGTVPLTWSVSV